MPAELDNAAKLKFEEEKLFKNSLLTVASSILVTVMTM